ncbi:proteasome assembly chaperone family protein [Halomicroarcula sp. GCM10025709]|uniref:proteasome assembly chaperone family protein n=1 Tax=Haloarcula TaxID=2237 RepID=UPI0024C3C706|nr:PAC2 family protein [Halomicroarcula sp. YJ-61-S]
MAETPRFELGESVESVDTLVVGVSAYGLAGLTAVDYLTDQRPMEQVGYLTGGGPPPITPFRDGVPRHHTRLYVDDERSFGVVVGERMVTVDAAAGVADAIEALCHTAETETVAVLSGVPMAHGPDDHVPFYIATEGYRASFLDGTDIRPMGNGFLDGLPAELLDRGIERDPLDVGVFTTPVHAQAPDAPAALRLLDALAAAHDLDTDTGPLEAFAANVEAHYQALAERLDAAEEDVMPDDRMYM